MVCLVARLGRAAHRVGRRGRAARRSMCGRGVGGRGAV